MGFNTTVLILNDGLNSIGEDRQFGSKLYEAIINCVTQSRRQGLYSGGQNVGEVIESHHASEQKFIVVGGNTGDVIKKTCIINKIKEE